MFRLPPTSLEIFLAVFENFSKKSRHKVKLQTIQICVVDTPADQTFVWNDKFSFNGFEPVDFAGPMDDATKQDAIADQGGPLQRLFMQKSANGDQWDVHITYLDQNNA